MMQRRDFLRGILQTAAAGTALVKLATPAEAQALTVGQPVVLSHPLPTLFPNEACGAEVYIRRVDGKFQCIGICRQITTHVPLHEEVFYDGQVTLIPGLKRGELFFDGRVTA